MIDASLKPKGCQYYTDVNGENVVVVMAVQSIKFLLRDKESMGHKKMKIEMFQ